MTSRDIPDLLGKSLAGILSERRYTKHITEEEVTPWRTSIPCIRPE